MWCHKSFRRLLASYFLRCRLPLACAQPHVSCRRTSHSRDIRADQRCSTRLYMLACQPRLNDQNTRAISRGSPISIHKCEPAHTFEVTSFAGGSAVAKSARCMACLSTTARPSNRDRKRSGGSQRQIPVAPLKRDARWLITRVRVNQKEAALRAASFESQFVFQPSNSSCSQSRLAQSLQFRASPRAPDDRSELRVSQCKPLDMLRDSRIAPCPQLQS